MKTKIVNCCRNCIFYDGSNHDFPVCTHPVSEQRGVYNNIVSRSHFGPEPVEEWCPIKKDGYLKIVRDAFDNIINKVFYKVKDNT